MEAVGEGATIALGTRVAIEPLRGCGECLHCRTGQYNRCLSRQLLGVTGRGGMAEYMVAPQRQVYPLADTTPLELASRRPIAVAVRGCASPG